MTYEIEIMRLNQNYEKNNEIKSQSYDLESHNYKIKIMTKRRHDEFKGQN